MLLWGFFEELLNHKLISYEFFSCHSGFFLLLLQKKVLFHQKSIEKCIFIFQ